MRLRLEFCRWRKTVDRTFQFSICLVLCMAIYRYCYLDADPYKCSALLNEGRWLDGNPNSNSTKSFENWQPPGCMMHEYHEKELRECFRDQRIVFIGDSTVRQIFWAAVKKLDLIITSEDDDDPQEESLKHNNMRFDTEGLAIQFIWDPWLNSSTLKDELDAFRAMPNLLHSEIAQSAALLFIGLPGLWYARSGREDYMQNFETALDNVMSHLGRAQEHSQNSWPLRGWDQSPNQLLLAPVQVPMYPMLNPSRQSTMTPAKVVKMNDYLREVSAGSNVDIAWSYHLMTSQEKSTYQSDGLHVGNSIALRKADVLFNLRCNANGVSSGKLSNRTCCNNYRQPTTAPLVILLTGTLFIPVMVWMQQDHLLGTGYLLSTTLLLIAWESFILAVCYCYVADRTQVFEKEQKQFHQSEFLAACFVGAAIGLVTIQKSVPARTVMTANVKHGLLPRDQTDEWKGWMQAFILIYHYTHGSGTLWIYKTARILVASYLFMTGFGHTLYFLKSNDYSLRRVAKVLLRLNLLSCVLPYMMRTDYLFYYFAPLISFWFLNIYFTLSYASSENYRVAFLFAKVMISASLTTVFTRAPGLLESLSLFLKYTCAIDWSVPEWRFRTSLDLYIVYVGVVTAILYHRSSKPTTSNRLNGTLFGFPYKYSLLFKLFGMMVLLLVNLVFWTSVSRTPDKTSSNHWHPYLSFIPILTYVALRNCNDAIRAHRSAAFCWLGRCSLETYILQYHIWLAGDTTGLLKIGLFSRRSEALILTPIFLWVSWRTAESTQTLTAWIVDGDLYSDGDRSIYKRGRASVMSPLTLGPSLLGEAGIPKEPTCDRIGGQVLTGLRWCVRMLQRDLRCRLALIVFVLWAANVTYG